MICTESLVDILKNRVSIQQLRDILEDVSEAMPDGYCPLCYEKDVPVDKQGDEIEGDDVSEAYEFQERHTEHCPVTWIEKYLVMQQKEVTPTK